MSTRVCLLLAETREADGITWREIAAVTSLHHGQISGSLSRLHSTGQLIRSESTRGGDRIYFHPDYAPVNRSVARRLAIQGESP